MKIYYLRHLGDNVGPYTIAELKTVGIGPEDFVWKGGTAEWVAAKDLGELKDILVPDLPPPCSAEKRKELLPKHWKQSP